MFVERRTTRFAMALYRGHTRIEQVMGKLKHFKPVALRREKTERNFRSIVALVATFILVKSVRTAWWIYLPERSPAPVRLARCKTDRRLV